MKIPRVAKWIVCSLAALVFTVVAAALVAPYGPPSSAIDDFFRSPFMVALPKAMVLTICILVLLRLLTMLLAWLLLRLLTWLREQQGK
jgi:hypothetical protein